MLPLQKRKENGKEIKKNPINMITKTAMKAMKDPLNLISQIVLKI